MSHQLIQGSAHQLTGIEDGSVNVICTSPPYFGLRAYSGDQDVEWPTVEYSPMPGLPPLHIQGCEPGCEHVWADELPNPKYDKRTGEQLQSTSTLGKNGHKSSPANSAFSAPDRKTPTQGAYCIHCGGWRGPLGLEPTIEAYIGHLILCLREWRRVLHPQGLVWVNLGDSYANDTKWGGSTGGKHVNGLHGQDGPGRNRRNTGLKSKDLMMIPARFALAAQADGWWLRSAIVWAKGVSFLPDYAGSCMPESVQDRPTQSYEMVYMLAKSPEYFYDAEAVKEANINPLRTDYTPGIRAYGENNNPGPDKRTRRNDGFEKYKNGAIPSGRNLRSVWCINPQPYPGAHFACWPPALVEPMIKASTSAHGHCSECGAPYRRLVERESNFPTEHRAGHPTRYGDTENGSAKGFGMPSIQTKTITTGWAPSCTCDAPTVPATVLDPFCGSGTTLQVAVRLGRHAIGVDLSTEYLSDLVPDRMDAVSTEPVRTTGGAEDWRESPLFADVDDLAPNGQPYNGVAVA